MTTEEAKQIVADVDRRQRKPDGSIYQPSHHYGIETRFENGGLCSDSRSQKKEALKVFERDKNQPGWKVVVYSRMSKPFSVICHN